MHRFFIEKIQGNTAEITDIKALHRIRDVLRLKFKDEIIVFDSAGHEYKGIVTAINKKQVELKLTPLKVKHKNTPRLTIASAIPRGGRMDDVIDYLTQLGVERIIPMLTDRVVVKLDNAKTRVRLERWRKIAQSAAQQCQRNNVPVISSVTDVKEVILNSQEFDLKLIPHISGERKLIKDVLTDIRPRNIIVLIGPEGDFTPDEVGLALHNGFIPVSLGDTILRVATAAIAVASYIKFALD